MLGNLQIARARAHDEVPIQVSLIWSPTNFDGEATPPRATLHASNELVASDLSAELSPCVVRQLEASTVHGGSTAVSSFELRREHSEDDWTRSFAFALLGTSPRSTNDRGALDFIPPTHSFSLNMCTVSMKNTHTNLKQPLGARDAAKSIL
jgi:hypothetical protein